MACARFWCWLFMRRGHDDAGRHMGDAHRRVGGVDVLAAGARGAHRVDADILVADFDVDVFDFRQHRDRRRRGVDAALSLRWPARAARDARPISNFMPRIDALARDIGDDFLEAPHFAGAFFHHVDLPALAGGIALIHAEQVAGEQRRLVAAGAAADFEDDRSFRRPRPWAAAGCGSAWNSCSIFGVELVDLGLGHLGHVLVADSEQRLGLGAIAAALCCRR